MIKAAESPRTLVVGAGQDNKFIRSIPYPEFLIIITIVSALDAITTHLILSMGGYEANPIVSTLYPNPLLLVLIKLGYILIIYGMSVWIQRYTNNGGWVLVIITSFITSFAIINNLIMLLL
jgi:hypothetical protein